MDALDKKLNEVYPGRVVRKDLLHRIKKGTNVPSFVLEFLLAKYCASDDPDEIEAGQLNGLEILYIESIIFIFYVAMTHYHFCPDSSF